MWCFVANCICKYTIISVAEKLQSDVLLCSKRTFSEIKGTKAYYIMRLKVPMQTETRRFITLYDYVKK
jgi:hypothetical protein